MDARLNQCFIVYHRFLNSKFIKNLLIAFHCEFTFILQFYYFVSIKFRIYLLN